MFVTIATFQRCFVSVSS